jgi:hypothetical protein
MMLLFGHMFAISMQSCLDFYVKACIEPLFFEESSRNGVIDVGVFAGVCRELFWGI